MIMAPMVAPMNICIGFLLLHAALILPTCEGFLVNLPPTRSSNLVGQHASHIVARADCKDGSMEVSRTFVPTLQKEEDDTKEEEKITETYNIAYKIFRPMTLSSKKASPILVLHGGPSVPSDYLFPLVNAVPYRSIIFYDQLGCGQSDEPKEPAA